MESDRLAQQLQAAEVSVAGARARLADLRQERAQTTAHRARRGRPAARPQADAARSCARTSRRSCGRLT
ncbi:MAG: hypothetical protein WDM77_01380 [Steroidobacteraceae bacterium]